jgi:aryl-alcohol dehydrogenase-like predicted oxidoreductase
MELALGTVQFGVPYGVGSGKLLLPNGEIRKILELAFQRGVTFLDTAPVYGDIESRLTKLCDGLEFRIVSKIPSIPETLDYTAAAQWAVKSAQGSLRRLGHKLYALLFHRTEDLLGARGDIIWSSISQWAADKGILIGASGYDVAAVRSLFEKRRMAIAQLPGNVLDQRIDAMLDRLEPTPELHLRSAFLQGLLLLPFEEGAIRVPAASAALQHWHEWLKARKMSPLQGALSVVKGFRDVGTCVVGIDNIHQLGELLSAWEITQPISARELASRDPKAIDPRLWGNGDQ